MTDPSSPELADLDAWQLAIRVVAMPENTNAYGDIFGGWLMSQADIAGSTLAIRAAHGRVATVAVKEFRFVAPVLVGDLVELYARRARSGTTSVTVEIQAWAQGEPDPRSRRRVASALITYVAVNAEGRPRRLAEPDPILA
jgi:acyl-CoA thioesterase YciA